MISPKRFTSSWQTAARGRLLTVRGELDLATAPTLERALASQTRCPGPLMLDLRALSFIDATGLAGPLGAATDARRHRYTLKLAPATPSPDCSNCARSTRASATPTHRPADPPADDLLRLNHAETSPRPAQNRRSRPHPTRPAARGDGRAPTLTSPTAMR
jgi:anti-anti-sigma factor